MDKDNLFKFVLNPNCWTKNLMIGVFLYGYRRITDTLRYSGVVINQKKVRRIMKKLAIKYIVFSSKLRKYNSYKGTIER